MSGTKRASKLHSIADQPHVKSCRGRRIGFRVVAVLLGVAPLLLCEWSLRVAGLGRPSSYVDPFVGFSKIHPLFELNEGLSRYQTVISRQRFFGAQEFAAAKASNGYRVFCLGGSTVHGRPYEPSTSFSKWIELELSSRVPSRRIEVINCGGVSYASYRLLKIVEEVLDYDPDLMVIATGHNEFLEDRTYKSIKNRSTVTTWIEDKVYSLRTVTCARQIIGREAVGNKRNTVLAEDVETRLDSNSGYASYHFDAQWRDQVIQHYEQSLGAMLKLCAEADVPVVLIKLGSNLRDCPPFKSEHKPGSWTDARREREWQEYFEEASEVEMEDFAKALSLYRRSESIAEQHALLAFRIARCLDQLNHFDEAREYYVKAMQWDVCPLRMLAEMHEIVDRVAAQNDTLVVDAKQLIAQQVIHGIPGHDWYVDHVHPSIGSHQQIARALIAESAARGLIPETIVFSEKERRGMYGRHLDQLGNAYLRNAGRRIQWLENWARRQRVFYDTLPSDVAAARRYGHRQFELGEDNAALAAYKISIETDPAGVQQMLHRALVLFRQGRVNATQKILDLLWTLSETQESRTDIELARLVVALDGDNQAAAVEIYERNIPAFKSFVKQSSSKWLEIMPDALSLAEALPRPPSE